MPSVKDFEKKHGHTKHNHKHSGQHHEAHHDETHEAKAETKAKRRPGREQEVQAESPDVAVVDVHADDATHEATHEELHDKTHEDTHENKVELNFYGSEILRAKFPKAFDVAESVATEWVHDGNFEGLPLGHPLAQYFAAKGLKKAKEVEKKVMESPVTEKVALQALQAGMKAQEIITQIREKVQKK